MDWLAGAGAGCTCLFVLNLTIYCAYLYEQCILS